MWKYIQLAALFTLIGVSNAFAQSGGYPSKPIRWVIPFAPGGGTDMVARPIASKLTDKLGQQILYDNRGGGGGIIAGEIVANANPDGYTLLVAAVAVMTVNVSLMKLPFDPVKDFAPITKFAAVPNMLAARASFPASKIQDVALYARANPGKLRWALSGPGSAGTLSAELFKLTTGIDFVSIPYKGAGPAMIAVLSSEADLMFANPAEPGPESAQRSLRSDVCESGGFHAAYHRRPPARLGHGKPATYYCIAGHADVS